MRTDIYYSEITTCKIDGFSDTELQTGTSDIEPTCLNVNFKFITMTLLLVLFYTTLILIIR